MLRTASPPGAEDLTELFQRYARGFAEHHLRHGFKTAELGRTFIVAGLTYRLVGLDMARLERRAVGVRVTEPSRPVHFAAGQVQRAMRHGEST